MNNIEHRLDEQSKEYRRDLATQSALNGLFQPYGVGRLNLSVAVGGYKNTQAVAIGSGYRPTQNFAVKAGVSTDLNSGKAFSYLSLIHI